MIPKIRLLLSAVLFLSAVILITKPLTLSSATTQATNQLISLGVGERILDNVGSGSSLAAPDASHLYVVRGDAGAILLYDSIRKRTTEIPGLGPSFKLLGIGKNGEMVLGNKTGVQMIDKSRRVINHLAIKQPSSLAVMPNGMIAVAAADNEKLIDIYDENGQLVRNIGQPRNFDQSNAALNIFLNDGKLIAGPAGKLIYVSTHALQPTIQIFSAIGELLSEAAVEGSAVQLQVNRAKQRTGPANSTKVGGIQIVNCATVDPVTGHLWLGLNGAAARSRTLPESGVLYEYNSDGVKLAEYALRISEPSQEYGFIVDVAGITVNSSTIYVLTSRGVVYRFSLNDRLARVTNPVTTSSRRTGLLGRLTSNFTSQVDDGRLSFALDEEALCPTEQTSYSCTANCGSSNVDCAAEARLHKAQNEIIYDSSCQANEQGCHTTIMLCNTVNGNRGSYTGDLTCPSPTPTPNPSPEECTDFEAWWVCNQDHALWEPYPACYCEYTPIVVDTAGNGISLTDGTHGVWFDIAGHGTKGPVAWTNADSDDAWLVLDLNGNGNIDDGTELFGNSSEYANGFLKLAQYDRVDKGGNGDEVIDQRDAIFSRLRLWQDANHNGISEPGELHGLPEFGVASISLDYRLSRRTDEYGNQFRYRAKLDDVKHSPVGRWAWDVFLVNH